MGLSSTPGPLTPIKLNPDFPPGLHHQFLDDHWSLDQIRAHQFFHQGELLNAAQISTQQGKTQIPPWTYLLIAHYLRSLNKDLKCSRPLSPFEDLCTKTSPQTHLISYIHNLLFADLKANETLACKKWDNTHHNNHGRELGKHIQNHS